LREAGTDQQRSQEQEKEGTAAEHPLNILGIYGMNKKAQILSGDIHAKRPKLPILSDRSWESAQAEFFTDTYTEKI
jgi:hypothetical protein